MEIKSKKLKRQLQVPDILIRLHYKGFYIQMDFTIKIETGIQYAHNLKIGNIVMLK